jgi:hypothetical protein
MRRKQRLRGASAALWTSINPVLGKYEIGYEADTNKLKVGNGSAFWNNLPYISAGSSVNIEGSAFVSPSGDNDTAELGNPFKPYATIAYAQEVEGAEYIVVFPGFYGGTITGVHEQVIFFYPGARISNVSNVVNITTGVTMQIHGYGIFAGTVKVNHASANITISCASITATVPFALQNGRLNLTVLEGITATDGALLQNASVLDLTVHGNWTVTVPSGRSNNKILFVSQLNHSQASVIRAKRISIINSATSNMSQTYKGIWAQDNANGRLHIYCTEIANDRDYSGSIPTGGYDAAIHVDLLKELIVYGNVKSVIDYGVQVISGTDYVEINGNIESTKNFPVLLTSDAGTKLIVNGDIIANATACAHAGKTGVFAWAGGGTLICNGKIINRWNDTAGHGVVKYPNCKIVLREGAGFYLTGSGSKPVSSSDASAQTIKIQAAKVFSNSAADANITNQLSAGEIVVDANVEF